MKTLYFLSFLFTSCLLFSQECEYIQNGKTIEINNMSVRINTDGTLFHHNGQGHFINPNLGPGSPSTIRKAGLWIGGFEAGTGVLKFAGVDGSPGELGSDFSPGPLDVHQEGLPYNEISCNYMNRVWEVSREEIERHIEDYYFDRKLDHPIQAIMDWPGNGNPYMAWGGGFGLPNTFAGWAPFYDRNYDGIYDPKDGDFPLAGSQLIIPEKIFWTVFNGAGGNETHQASGGDKFKVEVQLTGWGIECEDNPWVEDILFTEYKIINRDFVDYDSLFASVWVDFDLGCNEDDFVGSNVASNSFYAYNADDYDGDDDEGCPGFVTYEEYIPAMSVTFPDNYFAPLSKFMYYPNWIDHPGQYYPSEDQGFYNYMSGTWNLGVPLTYGGDGYDPGGISPLVDYAFPDPPSDEEGWSYYDNDGSGSWPVGIGSARYKHRGGTKTFQRGTVWKVPVVYGFHPHNNLTPIELVDRMIDYDLHNMEDVYYMFYSPHPWYTCNVYATASEYFERFKKEENEELSFELYPNPTNGKTTIKYTGGKAQVLAVYSVARELILFDNNIEADGRIELDLSDFREGIYFVRLIVDGTSFEERLVKF